METSKEAAQRAIKDLPQDAPVPLIWMLGKTGSGKSSIIRFITGADEAEIGNGFRPQTKNSREFSFPDDQTSLVRFLDTRGLGEAHYDPDEDLKAFGESTNLVIITVRATDQATAPDHGSPETDSQAKPRPARRAGDHRAARCVSRGNRVESKFT